MTHLQVHTNLLQIGPWIIGHTNSNPLVTVATTNSYFKLFALYHTAAISHLPLQFPLHISHCNNPMYWSQDFCIITNYKQSKTMNGYTYVYVCIYFRVCNYCVQCYMCNKLINRKTLMNYIYTENYTWGEDQWSTSYAAS